MLYKYLKFNICEWGIIKRTNNYQKCLNLVEKPMKKGETKEQKKLKEILCWKGERTKDIRSFFNSSRSPTSVAILGSLSSDVCLMILYATGRPVRR